MLADRPLPTRIRPSLKRFHYETHDQLMSHLADFVCAYNYARRLKTLGNCVPKVSAKVWRPLVFSPSPAIRRDWPQPDRRQRVERDPLGRLAARQRRRPGQVAGR